MLITRTSLLAIALSAGLAIAEPSTPRVGSDMQPKAGFVETAAIRWFPGGITRRDGRYIYTPETENWIARKGSQTELYFDEKDQQVVVNMVAEELNRRGLLKVSRTDGVFSVDTAVRVCLFFVHTHFSGFNKHFLDVQLEVIDSKRSRTSRYRIEKAHPFWSMTPYEDVRRDIGIELAAKISGDVENWRSNLSETGAPARRPIEPTGACRIQTDPRSGGTFRNMDEADLVRAAQSGDRRAAVALAVRFDDMSYLINLAKTGDVRAAYELYGWWDGKPGMFNDAWEMLCRSASGGYWKARIEIAEQHRSRTWDRLSMEAVRKLAAVGVNSDDRVAYMWLSLKESGGEKAVT
jgi:hypothetical protein